MGNPMVIAIIKLSFNELAVPRITWLLTSLKFGKKDLSDCEPSLVIEIHKTLVRAMFVQQATAVCITGGFNSSL